MWEINKDSASYDSYGYVYVGSLAASNPFVWTQSVEYESEPYTLRLFQLDSKAKQVVLESEDTTFYVILSDTQLVSVQGKLNDKNARRLILDGSWVKPPEFPNSKIFFLD